MLDGKKLYKTQMPGDSVNAERGAVAPHAYYVLCYFTSFTFLLYFFIFLTFFFYNKIQLRS